MHTHQQPRRFSTFNNVTYYLNLYYTRKTDPVNKQCREKLADDEIFPREDSMLEIHSNKKTTAFFLGNYNKNGS